MTEGFADLHTHTHASDGTEAPARNVQLAKEAGLSAVAITDHDTIAGLREAMEEGARQGIVVVPGVEISTVAGVEDIHVLGLYIKTDDPLLLERLKELRQVRDRRNELMIGKLQELGIPITMDEVLENMRREKSTDETVGRPHIAETLIRKGYASSLEDAFEKYIGRGAPAYANPPRIRPEEAIRWIHEAGGVAVLAHPGLYKDEGLAEALIEAGLDGIEAYHSDHSPEEAEKFRRLAESRGLIATAGSDFHGERNGKVFHGPLGSQRVSVQALDELLRKAESYRTP